MYITQMCALTKSSITALLKLHASLVPVLFVQGERRVLDMCFYRVHNVKRCITSVDNDCVDKKYAGLLVHSSMIIHM